MAVSTFSWLDINDDASRKVREAVSALDDRETLDPLGTGPIRDAFAEALFPGTSTIQTRLRYFLFVPWACQAVAASRSERRLFYDRLRDHEVRLIDALRPLGERHGIIGLRAGRQLSRLPSSVYWFGLGTWGIRRRAGLSLADYGDLTSGPWARGGVVRDDEQVVLHGAQPVWDPGLPDPPGGFPGSVTTLLPNVEEASYLRARIASTRLGGDRDVPSMLSHLAMAPEAWATAETPWDGAVAALPAPVRELLEHARCFSAATYGAQLLYNDLLASVASDPAGHAEQVRRQLDTWAGELDLGLLRRWWWAPKRFWAAVAALRVNVRPGTRAFVQRWIDAVVADPGHAVGDRALQAAIREQELVLKGRYARLTYQAAWSAWDGELVAGAALNYRWPTVKRFLDDLARGLAGEGADDAAA